MLTDSRPVPWALAGCFWAAGIVVGIRLVLALISRLMYGQWMHLPATPAGGAQAVMLSAALLLAPVYFFGVRRCGRAADFGLAPFPFARSLRLMMLGWLMWLAVSAPWAILMQRAGTQMQPNMLRAFGLGWRGYVVALVCGAIIAPLAEEIFFRGFLFGGLRKYYSFGVAAAVSAAVFGIVHFMPAAIVPLAAYGLVFAWLRERTGSIWPGTIMHMLVNSAGFTVQFALDRNLR